VEYALAALGSCQAITYRVWAAQLGIKLDKVEIGIEEILICAVSLASTTVSVPASTLFASTSL
jgi:hypothetical protein